MLRLLMACDDANERLHTLETLCFLIGTSSTQQQPHLQLLLHNLQLKVQHVADLADQACGAQPCLNNMFLCSSLCVY